MTPKKHAGVCCSDALGSSARNVVLLVTMSSCPARARRCAVASLLASCRCMYSSRRSGLLRGARVV